MPAGAIIGLISGALGGLEGSRRNLQLEEDRRRRTAQVEARTELLRQQQEQAEAHREAQRALQLFQTTESQRGTEPSRQQTESLRGVFGAAGRELPTESTNVFPGGEFAGSDEEQDTLAEPFVDQEQLFRPGGLTPAQKRAERQVGIRERAEDRAQALVPHQEDLLKAQAERARALAEKARYPRTGIDITDLNAGNQVINDTLKQFEQVRQSEAYKNGDESLRRNLAKPYLDILNSTAKSLNRPANFTFAKIKDAPGIIAQRNERGKIELARPEPGIVQKIFGGGATDILPGSPESAAPDVEAETFSVGPAGQRQPVQSFADLFSRLKLKVEPGTPSPRAEARKRARTRKRTRR
jgi:hypothetical protein